MEFGLGLRVGDLGLKIWDFLGRSGIRNFQDVPPRSEEVNV